MQKSSSYSLYLWRRLGACLYDLLLLIAIFFVITAIAVGLNGGNAIEHPMYLIGMYPVAFIFFVWCWKRGGQTLGMQAWRLQLVSETNTELTTKQCAFRYFLGSICFGFTYFGALFDAKKQPLHDSLAGTKIIFKNN